MPISMIIIGLLLFFALAAAAVLFYLYDFEGISMLVTIVAGMEGIIIFLCILGALMWQTNQGVEYVTKQQEYNTITQALTTSTDVVNTDLYTRAIEYNTDLAEWKYQDKHHWLGTWGNTYDWSALPYIELTGE